MLTEGGVIADFFWLTVLCAMQERDEAAEVPSSPIIASQGINAGIMGTSGRLDSSAIDDDDEFVDASEDPISDSFTSEGGNGAGVKQPYVDHRGPPVVDTRNDPDETFGPVKSHNASAQSGNSNQTTRGPAGFGDDDDEYEPGTDSTPGKKGLRARVKGKFGSKKEHHQEKKRNKAEQELDHRMHEKANPKAQAVTVSCLCNGRSLASCTLF